MGDSDVSTENEPLIGIEEVSSAGTKNAFNVKAEHVPKELSTLGIKAVFVVAFDTNHGESFIDLSGLFLMYRVL